MLSYIVRCVENLIGWWDLWMFDENAYYCVNIEKISGSYLNTEL